MHETREMTNKQVDMVGKHKDIAGKQIGVVDKQWSMGGVSPHQCGLPSALGERCHADHTWPKAFFLPKVLKNSCILPRFHKIKHNNSLIGAGSLNNTPLYR